MNNTELQNNIELNMKSNITDKNDLHINDNTDQYKFSDTFLKAYEEKSLTFPKIFDKRVIEKEYVNKYRFRTQASRDIKYDLVIEAEKLLNRDNAKNELLKYVEQPHIAIEMEKGLFEFALINVTINKTQNHFVLNVYNYQLVNLCRNLDINDKGIENTTLFPMIWCDGFDPFFVPFLSPEQMNPKGWSDIIAKRQLQEETVNGLQTTDLYTCKKCKDKRFKITELQIRSIDEPVTRFFTCMTCYYTFTM